MDDSRVKRNTEFINRLDKSLVEDSEGSLLKFEKHREEMSHLRHAKYELK